MAGSTLSAMMAAHKVTVGTIALLQHPLVELLIKLRDGSSPCGVALSPDAIVVDDRNSLVTLTADARRPGEPFDEGKVLRDYGTVLLQALAQSRQRSLAKIARQCADGGIDSLNDLYTLLERRAGNFVYVPLIALITALLAVLWWLNSAN